ncbi:MAG: rod shape-determining protein MreC [Solitalea-like symbiont of Acarus siro]
MRNLWIFITKYKAFFLFILFESLAIWIMFKSNDYHNSIALNASNNIIGNVYKSTDKIEEYFHLSKTNDDLATENMRLRNLLSNNYHTNNTKTQNNSYDLHNRQNQDNYKTIRYSYVKSKVINSTTAYKNNFLVLDKGYADGITPGMGVINGTSIVGITKDVTEHFCTVVSLLNSESKVSVQLENTNHKGSLIWKGNSINHATVIDIPNHIKLKTGDWIVTSNYSLFPEGLKVGYAYDTSINEHLLNIDIVLLTDMTRLEYVYIIKDKFA